MSDVNGAKVLDVLVTVKAYPQASYKYGEAVCVAGVRLDGPPSWVRLYPIEFRDLPWAHQFSKYDRIRLEASRRYDDRPESYFPDPNTIQLVESISPANGWERRRELLEGLEIYTMCELQDRQASDGTSLGMVFIPNAPELAVEKRAEADVAAEERKLQAARSGLFTGLSRTEISRFRAPLEPFPYYVRYVWSCGRRTCNGHEQSIIDWELVQAWRSWRETYGDEEVWVRIRDKWVSQMFSAERNTHIFAGNMHQRPGQFLVLGVFYPAIKR